ncbi:MAG: SRPBCC family protein [Hyphomicrobiales bacterium]
MKWIKRIFGTLLVLVVVLTGIAFLLPDRAEVSRSIVIAAPPERVYPYVSNFRKSNEWSPWARYDPDTHYTFDGPDQGAGQKMTWKSDHPQVGSGSQEIIAAEPGRSVDVALDMDAMGQAKARYLLEPEGAGTKVTWGFETELGSNPVGRYFGLMVDTFFGPDYETGLAALKKLVEAQPDGSG